jgi:HSP20 family protein
MSDFHHRINRFFDDAFFSPIPVHEDLGRGSWNPRVDVYDQDDVLVIKAELPGLDKKDVSVDVEGRVLTLKGERKKEHEVKEERYYRREMSYGHFERSFALPADADPEKIKADFKDGVLKIQVPKPEESKPKKITVH